MELLGLAHIYWVINIDLRFFFKTSIMKLYNENKPDSMIYNASMPYYGIIALISTQHHSERLNTQEKEKEERWELMLFG